MNKFLAVISGLILCTTATANPTTSASKVGFTLKNNSLILAGAQAHLNCYGGGVTSVLRIDLKLDSAGASKQVFIPKSSALLSQHPNCVVHVVESTPVSYDHPSEETSFDYPRVGNPDTLGTLLKGSKSPKVLRVSKNSYTVTVTPYSNGKGLSFDLNL
jgi:hypothetical protein